MWEFEQQVTKERQLHSLRISEKCQPTTEKKTQQTTVQRVYQKNTILAQTSYKILPTTPTEIGPKN